MQNLKKITPEQSMQMTEASEKVQEKKKGKLLQLLQGPYAYITTVLIAFTESFFFPIPPDVGILSILLAKPEKAMKLALHCTVASVLGGIVGYYLGMYMFDTWGQMIISTYGLAEKFESLRSDFHIYGFWILLFKGFTPIPFKLLTISSGVFGMPFGKFLFAAIVARSSRLFLIAWLIKKYGHHAREYMENSFGLVNLMVIIGIVIGFVLVKYFL